MIKSIQILLIYNLNVILLIKIMTNCILYMNIVYLLISMHLLKNIVTIDLSPITYIQQINFMNIVKKETQKLYIFVYKKKNLKQKPQMKKMETEMHFFMHVKTIMQILYK